MPQAILAINAGSSSIKFAAYATAGPRLDLLCRGMLDRHAGDTHFKVKNANGEILSDAGGANGHRTQDLTISLLELIEPHLGDNALAAVGHRIVHGGRDYGAPVSIDADVLHRLEALTAMAPLHQPACLAPARSLLAARPDLLQVACFDTAFHRGVAPVYRRFPLPMEFEDKGLHRYGFHGLSFEYIVQHVKRSDMRLVIAHLGSGSSLCAVRDGDSVNTTMSLTPLDGVMMGTRSGAIDPGLVLYLLKSLKMTPAEVEDLLYHKSGMLGVSGVSADMRKLLASSERAANDAIDQFCARVAEQIAVMATAIEGIDVLVFTGGIGENSPEIRVNVCKRLKWIGVMLDETVNAAKREAISAPGSRIEVLVIPTDEELVIGQHTRDILAQNPGALPR